MKQISIIIYHQLLFLIADARGSNVWFLGNRDRNMMLRLYQCVSHTGITQLPWVVMESNPTLIKLE